MLGGSARLGILATLNLSQISEFALASEMQNGRGACCLEISNCLVSGLHFGDGIGYI